MMNVSISKAVQVLLGTAEDPSILTMTDMTVSEGVTHEMLAIKPHQKNLLLTMIGVNTIIGLFYRILLIKNVVQTGLFSRPINLLTGFLRVKILLNRLLLYNLKFLISKIIFCQRFKFFKHAQLPRTFPLTMLMSS